METLSGMGLLIQFSYVVAGGLFIYGLKLLGSAATARRGNMLSAGAMLLAIVVALLDQGIVEYQWILLALWLVALSAARLLVWCK